MYKKFKKFTRRVKKKGFRFFFPYLYLLVLILSVLISIPSTYFPLLTICPTMFGTEICAPIGVYIGLYASFPGYFLVAQLMPKSDSLNWVLTLIMVILVSLVIYFLLGIFIDKYRSYKSQSKKLSVVIIAIFLVLLMALSVMLLK